MDERGTTPTDRPGDPDRDAADVDEPIEGSTIDRRDLLEGVVPDATSEPQSTERPDFARGQETDPDRLERMVQDRFPRGQEHDPTLHEQVHEGDFATGQSEGARHPEGELKGRFARGTQGVDPDDPNDPHDTVEEGPA